MGWNLEAKYLVGNIFVQKTTAKYKAHYTVHFWWNQDKLSIPIPILLNLVQESNGNPARAEWALYLFKTYHDIEQTLSPGT